jgi:hypothetical protein
MTAEHSNPLWYLTPQPCQSQAKYGKIPREKRSWRLVREINKKLDTPEALDECWLQLVGYWLLHLDREGHWARSICRCFLISIFKTARALYGATLSSLRRSASPSYDSCGISVSSATIETPLGTWYQTTASNMVNTNRRQRNFSACNFCRVRRTKCDRSRPKCGTCARRNVDCIYSEVLSPVQSRYRSCREI